MKTLVAIWDRALRANIFDAGTLLRLDQLGEVTWLDEPPVPGAFADALADCDACITSWDSPRIGADTLRRATRLRFIGHAAGTLTPYLDAEVFERNIVVVNAGRQLAMSTAECTLALMLAGAWQLHAYSERMRAGGWSASRRETLPGVHGRTIGLVGLGDVSRQLIHYLRAFDTRILLHSHHCTEADATALGVERAGLNDLVSTCDIVSLHGTLTSANAGMFGRRQIEAMRDGALLVNTARARLVDNAALREHLRRGRIAAALDVFDTEPLSKDDDLLHWPNVSCAPHIGGMSGYWRKQIGAGIVDGLAAFIDGREPPNRVGCERFHAMSAH